MAALHAIAARSQLGVVATGTVEATRAGVRVLEGGGNAVDAAVAAALALGVVDPGDSGLGGATYVLIALADGRTVAIDGSAVVPFAIDRGRLEDLRQTGGQSGYDLVAVPGSLAALDLAAARYGTWSLAELLAPAIELAASGYRPSPFQIATIASYGAQIAASPNLSRLVLAGGTKLPDPADLICRPELLATLRRIAAGGTSEFYRGSIAVEIDADMRRGGGPVRMADLATVKGRELEPARGSYRGREILSFPHPGSGEAVIHALDILERFDAKFLATDSTDRLQAMAEAFHIAVIDHQRAAPLRSGPVAPDRAGLLDKELAARRAALIRFGRPLTDGEVSQDGELDLPDGATTQVSVVDRHGNAVSLTQTLGRFFGSKTATASLGFPYNGLLEGRARASTREPVPTTMAPTIVREAGEVRLVLGSSGSVRIPAIIASVVSNVVDRRLDVTRAVASPRVLWGDVHDRVVHIELYPPITVRELAALEHRGYRDVFWARLPTPISRLSRFGGVNAVAFDPSTRLAVGIGDPRRDGFALGARW